VGEWEFLPNDSVWCMRTHTGLYAITHYDNGAMDLIIIPGNYKPVITLAPHF